MGSVKGSIAVGQRLIPGRKGSVSAGGQIDEFSGRLCGSQTIAAGSQGRFISRAKITVISERYF